MLARSLELRMCKSKTPSGIHSVLKCSACECHYDAQKLHSWKFFISACFVSMPNDIKFHRFLRPHGGMLCVPCRRKHNSIDSSKRASEFIIHRPIELSWFIRVSTQALCASSWVRKMFCLHATWGKRSRRTRGLITIYKAVHSIGTP